MNMPSTKSSVPVPVRSSSQRQTWPIIIKSKLPGSHAFDEVPILRRTPWETQRKQGRPDRTSRPHMPQMLASQIFNQLPTPVYHCILQQLELLYVTDMSIDASGVLRDLRACCLVNKRWLHPAREHLYHRLWLLRDRAFKKRKMSLTRSKSRLEMLVRTLSEHRSLALLVEQLYITPALQEELNTPKSFVSRSRYALDLLREIIELCPGLQQVNGFLPELAPQNATYFQTLLRRPHLKALFWWTHPESWFLVDVARLGQYETLHGLQTLILSQGNSSRSMSVSGSLLPLLEQMPALRSLMLAGLSREDVNDTTIQSLPPLRQLRLDNLMGITDKGILKLSETENIVHLKSLTLNGLQVKSMDTIIAILEACYQLERLRFVQLQAPTVLQETMQYLESESLQYLHWETLIAGETTKAIADSISQNAFPELTTIKAPCDHEGHFQALCRPLYEQELTTDDKKFLDRERLHASSYSIRLAQLRAQLRIQEQRRQPSFNLIIEDEDATRQTDVIGSFLGRLDSSIAYSLEPDIPGGTVALSQLSDFLQTSSALPSGASMSSLDLTARQCPAYSYDLLF